MSNPKLLCTSSQEHAILGSRIRQVVTFLPVDGPKRVEGGMLPGSEIELHNDDMLTRWTIRPGFVYEVSLQLLEMPPEERDRLLRDLLERDAAKPIEEIVGHAVEKASGDRLEHLRQTIGQAMAEIEELLWGPTQERPKGMSCGAPFPGVIDEKGRRSFCVFPGGHDGHHRNANGDDWEEVVTKA